MSHPLGKKFNNLIDTLHLDLGSDEKYVRLLEAIYPEQTVEGTLALDDAMAAQMIRDHAIRKRHTYATEWRLSHIIRALHVVLKRYGMGRTQRREEWHKEWLREEGITEEEFAQRLDEELEKEMDNH